jgi:hypothetical protein
MKKLLKNSDFSLDLRLYGKIPAYKSKFNFIIILLKYCSGLHAGHSRDMFERSFFDKKGSQRLP